MQGSRTILDQAGRGGSGALGVTHGIDAFVWTHLLGFCRPRIRVFEELNTVLQRDSLH